MVVATGYDLFKALEPNRHAAVEGNLAPIAVNAHQWIVLGIGFIVSFFVALAVVAWFMQWVRTRGFVPFAVYRIALGLAILAASVAGWL